MTVTNQLDALLGSKCWPKFLGVRFDLSSSASHLEATSVCTVHAGLYIPPCDADLPLLPRWDQHIIAQALRASPQQPLSSGR